MRNRSSFLFAVAVMLATGGSAFAADMVVKAPPAAVVASTWTGFYAGLNAGGGWENTIDNSASLSFCNSHFDICADVPSVIKAAVPGQFNTRPRGFIGGGQIGYNVQAGAFVWGIETDFQGANITGDASAASAVGVPGFNDTIAVAGTGSQKIDWFGTLRGRLGWLPVNPLLVYATGGLAYGHVQTGVSFSGSHLHLVQVELSGSTALSQSDTRRVGWTVGGGLEWMFAPRWSLKAEYLYYDLGAVILNPTLTLTPPSSSPFRTDGISANIQSSAHYAGNIARAGVNYHF